MNQDRGLNLLQLYQDAFEALPEAIAIFDSEDRFVFWNSRFAEIYGRRVALRVGNRFVDHVRATLSYGLVPDAIGREEAWIAERLARFADPNGVHIHKLADGRWVRVQERPLAHGGRIGIRADLTELKEQATSFRLLFEANPVPMIVSDRVTGEILSVNEAAVTFYGYPRETFLTMAVGDLGTDEPAGVGKAPQDEALADTVVHRTALGDPRWVHMTVRDLDHAGRSASLAAIFDLTDKVRAERDARRTRSFLTQLVDQLPTPMFAKDMEAGGRYVIFNRASEALFDLRRAEVIGRTDEELFGAEAASVYRRQDLATLELGSLIPDQDDTFKRPDGSIRAVSTRKVALTRDESGDPGIVLGVSEDVTDRRADEARLAHIAQHDGLTGLPARFLFRDRLAAALAARRGGEILAVMFLDLDGFKPVNDTYGHAAGDEVLRQVADRLRATLRPADIAARFGGDEFAILHTALAEPGEAALMAARCRTALMRPYLVRDQPITVGASIGIALAPLDGDEPSVLLQVADAAQYRAKREGQRSMRARTTSDLDGSPRRASRRKP